MASANRHGGFLGPHMAGRRGIRFIRVVTALASVAAAVWLVTSS